MPRKKRTPARPGTLMLIGGAEDKFEQKYLLKNFFESCGGPSARISILPSASESEESGALYHQILSDFGARSAQLIPLFKRDEAELLNVASDIEKSTGIFMTGGDQRKIVSILHATATLRAIK